MDETLLLPSPNWFLVSGMAVSSDGWVIYGGPSKSLCILEPLPPDDRVLVREHNGYRAHVFGKVHGDRVTTLDISPEWPEKKCFISGAGDGSVKQWLLEKQDNVVVLKSTHNHTMHLSEEEEVAALGYSTNNHAVTVGALGRVIKWDLSSNIIKSFDLILSKFKPTCIACSMHVFLQVAVGTKQGIVFVLDLTDTGKILFKVRSHDDEILSLSWCPQLNVVMKTFLRKHEQKKSVNDRMARIRQETENEPNESLNESGVVKALPADSFDETVVEEEDLFDVYKEPEEDEFGHKKYVPEVITVKEKAQAPELDFLAECKKLKEKILQSKESEPSINSLVDALDKTHVTDVDNKANVSKKQENTDIIVKPGGTPQRHLLASIGKHGNLRIWAKTGKLVGSGLLQNRLFLNKYPNQKVNQPPWATLLWYKPDVLLITDARGQLLQCNPLIVDSRNKVSDWQLVDTIHKRGTFCMISNAPRVQYGYVPDEDSVVENKSKSKKKLQQQNEESKNIASTLPEDKWFVWTAAQDRTFVCYSMTHRKKMSNYSTCGALVYNIQTCPYDAKRLAICVGDGAVRIWETDLSEDEKTLTVGQVSSYWQNVQGKVLTTAWHPTRENIVAFGTAESRVGILDISGNCEKPARVLHVGVSGGVYSLCWGDRNELYICGGTDIVAYRFRKDSETKTISVKLEGETWRLTAASWYPMGLMCGSFHGAVGLLSNTTSELLAVNFVFKKLINCIEWHPQYTSSSSEESSLKDLIAVTSMDKNCLIAILKHSQTEEGKHQLETLKFLEGHKGIVLQLAWNPHHEGQLASTSNDCTVRVWDVPSGTCTSIFSGHGHSSISLAWSAFPQLANVLVSGGSDFSVRVWRVDDYPADQFNDNDLMLSKKEKIKKLHMKRELEKLGEGRLCNDKVILDALESDSLYGEGKQADQMSAKLKACKRFLLPISSRQIGHCTAMAAKKLASKYIVKEDGESDEEANPEAHYDTEFLKMFGTTNELNELLDKEMAHHLEAKDTDAWIMLAIFRGQIDSMIKFASENDIMCPFLVSISPSVSFKYWKDVVQLYLAQINRFVAQGREHRLQRREDGEPIDGSIHIFKREIRSYGGPTFRKAALLLSVHDVRGAVDCLLQARLFREAYVLCRARHMESIAQETLWHWLRDNIANGNLKLSVICYIALGELYKASTMIAGITKEDETWLSLGVELAKVAGQHTFAGHLEDKKEQIKQIPKPPEQEDDLEELPSRVELFLNNDKIENEDEKESTIKTKEE